MMLIFAILGCAIVIALAVGQFMVVSRAIHQKEAGLGRFTYSFADRPSAFFAVLGIELVGMVLVFAYGLSVIVAVLFP